MQALRLAAPALAPALALAAVLSSVFLILGFVTAARTAGDAPGPSPDDHEPVAHASTRPPDGPSGGKTLSASVPTEDAGGGPAAGLPRYPGSVRAAYSETRTGGLSVVRAGYAAEDPPGAVRDFYADVFRSGGWRMANVEYAGGEWYLLAVRGGREAGVEVSPRGGGSFVAVEVSRPRAQEEAASDGGSKR